MALAWTLREGRESDVRAMYMLDLLCFEEPFRFNLTAMRRFVLQHGAIAQVAEAEGKLAGFVVIHLVRRRGQRIAYVVTLDVAMEFRRQGLALALMHAAEEQAAAAGAIETMLHVHAENSGAISFYERAGYQQGERIAGFYGDGRDAWLYAKPLEHPSVTP
jgi:ribosomal protein S18 acetylase RimI-like enzyme